MISWILDNKKWLFSGLGVAVLAALATYVGSPAGGNANALGEPERLDLINIATSCKEKDLEPFVESYYRTKYGEDFHEKRFIYECSLHNRSSNVLLGSVFEAPGSFARWDCSARSDSMCIAKTIDQRLRIEGDAIRFDYINPREKIAFDVWCERRPGYYCSISARGAGVKIERGSVTYIDFAEQSVGADG